MKSPGGQKKFGNCGIFPFDQTLKISKDVQMVQKIYIHPGIENFRKIPEIN